MGIRIRDYIDAVERLPEGRHVGIQQSTWADYERLLADLTCHSRLRISYDKGRLEIMSGLPGHEKYARFMDDLVRTFAEQIHIQVEKLGGATWKRRKLDRGIEPDCCYYAANADQIIGKSKIDLEVDSPPDVVVEIDITSESLAKFAIYSALQVPEVWRYDARTIQFYELIDTSYFEISESPSFPGLKPDMLIEALEESKIHGQTIALESFRKRIT